MRIVQQAKRPKTLDRSRVETTISDPSDNLSVSGVTQEALSNSLTSSWLESGDARKCFAPSSSGQYESQEYVRAIVMDRRIRQQEGQELEKCCGIRDKDHQDMSLFQIRGIDIAIAKYVSRIGITLICIQHDQ
jgi:hypothetical protein